MVEEQWRFVLGGEIVGANGQIERHVLKEVLAKLVGETAGFL